MDFINSAVIIEIDQVGFGCSIMGVGCLTRLVGQVLAKLTCLKLGTLFLRVLN